MAFARARSSSVVVGLSVLVLALAACSGAGNQDLFEASDESDTSAATPSSSPSDKGDGEGPKKPDPGPAAQGDKCTPEREPNDDAEDATEFTTGFCGKIEDDDDVDYGTFVVPQDVTTMTWKIHETGGKAEYRFSVFGVSFSTNGDTMRAIPGATYQVQIKSASGNSGNRPTYELSVSFK